MRTITVLFLALALAASGVSAAPPADDGERAAIEKAVRDYLEGWYTGDAARMERALHPELAKRMVGSDPRTGRSFLQPIGASAMINFTAAGAGKLKPGEDAAIEIAVLDVFRSMATVRAKSVAFMDYVQLGKLDGEWKVVNVLWERMAPPPPPAPPAAPAPK
jgi:hypothetical protein